MRRAFTVVELLVAIIVVTIGLLALAATAGLVASQVGDGGRLTSAAHVARSVLDSLGTSPCKAIVGGGSRRDGIIADWAVSGDSTAALVDLEVATGLRRGIRRDTYRLLVPCAR